MANNDRVRFRYGICLNDKCSKCTSKEVQEIPARKDLVCTECGKPLRECPPPKKKNKMLPIIIGAAVVVIGGGVGAVLGLSGKDKPEQEPVVIDTPDVQTQSTDTVAVEPVVAEPEPAKPATTKPAGNTGATSGGSNLGWGNYSGPMQGGKPHGVGGTIKVKQNYSIDLKDGRGSTLQVQPGETIENTKFENGRLRAGELHRANGERKWFNC